jgi:hypothetical protein
MATSNYAKSNYRFLSSTDHNNHRQFADDSFELDESDLYNNSVSTHSNSPEFFSKPSRLGNKTRTSNNMNRSGLSASVPINIPDWSKILGDEYRGNQREETNGRGDDDDDESDGGDEVLFDGGAMIPPHEFLARTRIASCSVQEGIGRTLKGRDLSKVRNAIWEKIGFQD